MLFSWFYCSVVLLIDISFSIKYSDTLNADVLSDRPLAVEKKVNDHFSQFKAGEWNNVSRHFVEEVRPGIKNDSKDLKEPPRIHNKYFTSRWYLYKRKRALGPEQGQGHNMAATNELEPMAPKLLNTVRHPNEAEQKTQWKENPPSVSETSPGQKQKREHHEERGSWTPWSNCSVTCGKGRQIRWRHCNKEKCATAQTEKQEKTCQLPECSLETFLGLF